MPVKIEFETSNAAFRYGHGDEIASILRDIADVLEDHGLPDPKRDLPQIIQDSNGNRIGQWSATIDAEQEECEG